MTIAIVIHVFSMAACARMFGVTLRRIVCGYGPELFQSGIFQVRLFPGGGHVKLKDSRDEELSGEDLKDAFDHQPAIVQAAIPLAGPLVLVLVSFDILGVPGWDAFTSGFGQIFAGALQPLSEGQALLGSFASALRDQSVLAVLGLLCAKVAAFNALPIPVLNGGQALMALAGIKGAFHARLQQLGVLALLAVYAGWLAALASYIVRSAAYP